MKILLVVFFVLMAVLWTAGVHVLLLDTIAGTIAAILMLKFDANPCT